MNRTGTGPLGRSSSRRNPRYGKERCPYSPIGGSALSSALACSHSPSSSLDAGRRAMLIVRRVEAPLPRVRVPPRQPVPLRRQQPFRRHHRVLLPVHRPRRKQPTPRHQPENDLRCWRLMIDPPRRACIGARTGRIGPTSMAMVVMRDKTR